jgi:hypothetical protein
VSRILILAAGELGERHLMTGADDEGAGAQGSAHNQHRRDPSATAFTQGL